MSEPQSNGKIVWTDLTVSNCEEVRDFYAAVAGWSPSPVSLGEYDDFCMNSADGTTVAGICHARNLNAHLPPQWLIYINVENLADSIQHCESMGGKVLQGAREMGGGKCVVIQDPAGAVAVLVEPSASD